MIVWWGDVCHAFFAYFALQLFPGNTSPLLRPRERSLFGWATFVQLKHRRGADIRTYETSPPSMWVTFRTYKCPPPSGVLGGWTLYGTPAQKPTEFSLPVRYPCGLRGKLIMEYKLHTTQVKEACCGNCLFECAIQICSNLSALCMTSWWRHNFRKKLEIKSCPPPDKWKWDKTDANYYNSTYYKFVGCRHALTCQMCIWHISKTELCCSFKLSSTVSYDVFYDRSNTIARHCDLWANQIQPADNIN